MVVLHVELGHRVVRPYPTRRTLVIVDGLEDGLRANARAIARGADVASMVVRRAIRAGIHRLTSGEGIVSHPSDWLR